MAEVRIMRRTTRKKRIGYMLLLQREWYGHTKETCLNYMGIQIGTSNN